MVAIETDAKKLFNSAGELATGFVLLRLPAELETGDGLMLTTRGRWAVKAGVFVDGATKTLPAGAEVEIVHVFNVDDDSGRGVRKDRTTRWVEVPAGTTLEYVDLITDHVTVPPAAGPGVPAWAVELLEAIGDMETLTDTTMTAVAADEDSAFSVQQRATFVSHEIEKHNLLAPEFGISIGSGTSQSAAINAAFAAYPGEGFFIPAGVYNIGTMIDASSAPSLEFAPGAVFQATASMAAIMTYGPSSGYVYDREFRGGTFDGANLATACVIFRGVSRQKLSGATFKNGINRGVQTVSPCGGIIMKDLSFSNDLTTNVTDNIAIHLQSNDSQVSDVIIRDWTIGVRDDGMNIWNRVHPWLGPGHTASRYPTSVAFLLAHNSKLRDCYPDTYRIPYRIEEHVGGGTSHVQISGGQVLWNDAVVGTATMNANPSDVVDIVGAQRVKVDDLWIVGVTGVAIDFINGTTTYLNAKGNLNGWNITGVQEWLDGTPQGLSAWTPTFYGATVAGVVDWASSGGFRTGSMIVRGDTVTYTFRLKGTTDATIDGTIRIGGFPVPTGKTVVSPSGATISYRSLLVFDTAHFSGSTGGSAATLTMVAHDGSGNINALTGASNRSKTFEVWGTIVATIS